LVSHTTGGAEIKGENIVVRRIFGPKRWRKQWEAGEKLHNLYTSPNIRVFISKRMRRVRHATHMGEMTNACNILAGKPERKRPLGRPRHRWLDIIINLRETGWEGVDWIHLAEDRNHWQAVMNTVMNPCVP
jgi:hypothetical protein